MFNGRKDFMLQTRDSAGSFASHLDCKHFWLHAKSFLCHHVFVFLMEEIFLLDEHEWVSRSSVGMPFFKQVGHGRWLPPETCALFHSIFFLVLSDSFWAFDLGFFLRKATWAEPDECEGPRLRETSSIICFLSDMIEGNKCLIIPCQSCVISIRS